jgi:hypothetical protein
VKRIILFPAVFIIAIASAQAPKLDLPARRADAPTGSAFAKSIENLPLEERESQIYKQVQEGNVPDFERQFVPVEVTDGVLHGHIYVAPDYLAVGTNEDYFFVPMTPYTAQKIADLVHCSLPTPKMVDDIYAAATVKLDPSPIPPTPAMTSVPEFETHNQTVKDQRAAAKVPLGALTAGDKKDIVICAGLTQYTHNVAIYGWHLAVGKPIQPLYLKHLSSWADYSHGVRLVSRTIEVEGKPAKLDDVLADPASARLLSSEGVLTQPRYVFKEFPKELPPPIRVPKDEKLEWLKTVPGVRILIDEPAVLKQNVLLVLYALPNGNTIEETFGRKLLPQPVTASKQSNTPGWRFDIQHIGAQTRFLRQELSASGSDPQSSSSLVVAYLENEKHSWPTFLKTQNQELPITVVSALIDHFKGSNVKVVLDSHSGGGAFVFAYIRQVPEIPANIERIAFLDSEYNYETSEHFAKFTAWLQDKNHSLCLIAYDDASALYQGKPFVTAQGGTWGRTHLMLQDLGQTFNIKRTNTTDPERYASDNGQIVIWLKENPNHEIFHTVQVERNGFIESILSGTPLAGKDYVYFGDRAYSSLIGD